MVSQNCSATTSTDSASAKGAEEVSWVHCVISAGLQEECIGRALRLRSRTLLFGSHELTIHALIFFKAQSITFENKISILIM